MNFRLYLRYSLLMRAVDMDSVCSCYAVRACGRFGLRAWLFQPQLGCFSLCTWLLWLPRAVALTLASSCFCVSAWLFWRLHAIALAFSCGCFGVHSCLLWSPRTLASALHAVARASTRGCFGGLAGLL